MRADRDAVYPRLTLPVAGADVKQHSLALREPSGGNCHAAAVPYAAAEIGVANSGKHAFAAEGDGYALRQ